MKIKQKVDFSCSYPCPQDCRNKLGCSFKAVLSFTEDTNEDTKKNILTDVALELLKPEGCDDCSPGEWYLRFAREIVFEGDFKGKRKDLILNDKNLVQPPPPAIRDLCDVDSWDADFNPVATGGHPYKFKLKAGYEVGPSRIKMEIPCTCSCSKTATAAAFLSVGDAAAAAGAAAAAAAAGFVAAAKNVTQKRKEWIRYLRIDSKESTR